MNDELPTLRLLCCGPSGFDRLTLRTVRFGAGTLLLNGPSSVGWEYVIRFGRHTPTVSLMHSSLPRSTKASPRKPRPGGYDVDWRTVPDGFLSFLQHVGSVDRAHCVTRCGDYSREVAVTSTWRLTAISWKWPSPPPLRPDRLSVGGWPKQRTPLWSSGSGRSYCILRFGGTMKAARSPACAVPALTIRATSTQNGPTGMCAYFLRA